jgi:ribosomal protein L11 methyltransferase
MGSTVAVKDWIEVRISSTVDAGELLGMLNDPDVTGAWEEDGMLRLYWPAGRWNSGALAQLKEAVRRLSGISRESPAGAAIAIERLPDRDWNDIWAKSVRPIRIGRRFVIRPSWEPVALGPQDIELVLDPKQAFGTGHHATTRLLLEWLEDLIRGGEKVLDAGTGSGILAMAAVRLGAASALGIDHDPVALACAQDYAATNGFGPELDLREGTLHALTKDERRQFDLVLANLDRQTILESVESFAPFLRTGARLFLCGILVEDRTAIAKAFATIGGVVRAERNRDGWLALEVLVPDSCDS